MAQKKEKNMKRFLFTAALLALTFTAANAQKTVVKTESFSSTQARMLEVTAKSYVRPLVVDLVVPKGQKRLIYSRVYTRTDVEVGLSGNLDNLRSRVIYDATSDWNCDAVVAATFKIELLPDDGYSVEMKGFPANFDPDSWHPMEENDYQWLQVDKAISFNDANKQGAVIQNIKK